jgi:hypothetical protein
MASGVQDVFATFRSENAGDWVSEIIHAYVTGESKLIKSDVLQPRNQLKCKMQPSYLLVTVCSIKQRTLSNL